MPDLPGQGPPLGHSLARKGVCNVLNTALVVARSIILSVLVARALGPHLQGVYSVLLYLVQVAVQLVSLGFPNTLVRFVARRDAEGDPAGAHAVIGHVVRRELILGSALTVMCWLLAGPLGTHVAHTHGGMILLASLAILPDSLTLAYESSLEGQLAYEVLLKVNLALVPASVAAAVVALALGGRVTELLVLKVALALVRVAWYRRILTRRLPPPRPLEGHAMTEMNRYTRSLSLIFLFDAVVWQRSELLFLGIFCQPEAIAFYDIAYQIVGTAMRVVPEKLADILFPVMAGTEGRGERDRTGWLYHRSVRLLFALTLGMAVTLAVQAPLLVTLVYGDAYRQSATVVRILCAAAPIIIVARATAYLLYAAGWQDFNVRLAGAGAVLNLVLAWVLVPRWCVVGAAVANSTTQVLSVVVLVTYVTRRSRLTLPWGSLVRCVGAAFLQASVMGGLATLLRGWVLLAGASILGLVVYLIVLRALGVLSGEEWATLVRWYSSRSRGTPGAGGRN